MSAAAFSTKVKELQERNEGMNRQQAVAAVARRHPDLHAAFVAETQPTAAQKRAAQAAYGITEA